MRLDRETVLEYAAKYDQRVAGKSDERVEQELRTWEDPALASVKLVRAARIPAAETARARRQSRSAAIILLRHSIPPTHLGHAS